jgi:hypothetical protein
LHGELTANKQQLRFPYSSLTSRNYSFQLVVAQGGLFIPATISVSVSNLQLPTLQVERLPLLYASSSAIVTTLLSLPCQNGSSVAQGGIFVWEWTVFKNGASVPASPEIQLTNKNLYLPQGFLVVRMSFCLCFAATVLMTNSTQAKSSYEFEVALVLGQTRVTHERTV